MEEFSCLIDTYAIFGFILWRDVITFHMQEILIYDYSICRRDTFQLLERKNNILLNKRTNDQFLTITFLDAAKKERRYTYS